MEEVAIIGYGQSNFGDLPEKTFKDIFEDAFLECLESVDYGIEKNQIDEVFLGSLGTGGEQLGLFSPTLSQHMGLDLKPSLHVENACASAGFAFRLAVQAVASGLSEIALAGGVEKMNHLSSREGRKWLGVSGDTPWERLAGTTFPGLYAQMASRHINDYDTKREHLSKIAVKNHSYGSKNEKAHLGFEISLEQAKEGPKVAYPLNLYDCCPTTDGASALLLTTVEKAKDFTDSPIRVLGTGAASEYPSLFDRPDIVGIRATREASDKAYEMADCSPSDIDFAELHDCFTIAELIAYEDLGFCEKGKGSKMIDREEVYIGGEIPVNVSGGLKSKGHPIGATGGGQIYEICKQLRGEVNEERQVPDAEIGLAHNVGGSGGAVTVNILSL